MSNLDQIKQLRATIRKQRRKLSRFDLKQAEFKTIARLIRLAEVKSSKKIGVYLDAFGEVPTYQLIINLLKFGKKVYLPHISPMMQSLVWKEVTLNHLRSQRFAKHHLGMQQIEKGRFTHTIELDTVIMPLVVFDRFGSRIGMGGGFYDRTLALAPYHPIRIGLAHSFQFTTDTIPIQPWDQSLQLVCTPHKIWRF